MFHDVRHLPYSNRLRCAAIATLALIAGTAVFTAPPTLAAERESAWVDGPLSRVRLVAGDNRGEMLRAGVEISLKSGAHTYWRYPGDSGVPPTFDFSGSQNLKSATIRYPAPQRMIEGSLQVYGYKGEVIFPVEIKAIDDRKPVVLALHFNYAACEKICTPAEARLRLTLDPQSRAISPHASRIDIFAARAPRPFAAAGAPAMRIIAIEKQPKPRWRVSVEPASQNGEDLFAEGPDGWAFDTRRAAPGLFDMILAEKPADALSGAVSVMITLTTPAGAFEGVKYLDVSRIPP